MKALRVAVLGTTFIDWGGGIDFLAYLVRGLSGVGFVRTRVFMPRSHAPFDTHMSTKKRVLKLLLREIAIRRRGPATEVAELSRRFQAIDPSVEITTHGASLRGLLTWLGLYRPDMVFPTLSPLGPAFPLPWVGCITDLQHRALPHYFDESERIERDHHFQTMLNEAPAIIVNSQFIKEELVRAYNANSDKLYALPFCPFPEESWLENTDALAEKYDLPARFFLVANQFWAHKGHFTILEAMKLLLAEAQEDVHLVCTGKLEEPRNPEYVEQVQELATQPPLAGKVHFIGYLPKLDQVAVMKKAVAVVQPTEYEGGPGGGSAYNAIALGIPLVLSDITINKEIQEPGVCFFPVGSPGGLAEELSELLGKSTEIPTTDILRKRGTERLARLSESIAGVLEQAHAAKQ